MKKTLFTKCIFSMSLMLSATLAYASLTVPMYWVSANGQGEKIGTVKADDTIYGLLLTPNLTGLPPGTHGFHVHQFPMCGNSGAAAGGHLDPLQTNKHLGPYRGNGHLGDLPVLIVDENGKATLPVLAPRLKLDQIKGHALMIHAGSDNYSDKPKMGGGGARLGCGEIKYF